MTPEELAEARHYVACYQDGYVHDLMHNLLDHIDQQTAGIAELDDAVSGPLENITKMLETVNADTILAGVIQTWKNENGTLKTRITELEATVAALKEEFLKNAYERNKVSHGHAWYPDNEDYTEYLERVDADAHKKAQESLDSVLAGALHQLAEEHPEVD